MSYEQSDEANFIESVGKHSETEAVRLAILELLEFAKCHAEEIEKGQAKSGSFHYKVGVGAKGVTLFTCDAYGTVTVSLANFERKLPGTAIRKLKRDIAALPGTEEFAKPENVRPALYIKRSLASPPVMVRFERAILAFQRVAEE
jgi:hypothetical protein